MQPLKLCCRPKGAYLYCYFLNGTTMPHERRGSSNHEFMTFERPACHCSHDLFCLSVISFVAYLLKTRTVGPKKEPWLANGSETTFVSSERMSKHVPPATDTNAIIEVVFKRCFLLCPCKCIIRKTTGATESVLHRML
jgi:hypothetical protein